MDSLPVLEATVPFNAPNGGKPGKTWYKIIGDLSPSPNSTTPLPPVLVALHGGPGAGHQYLSPLTDLYLSHRIPIIFYDQVGCGNSTHYREKLGDTSFWTFDLFLAELDNLIDHLRLRSRGFYVLGQSWGGMLVGTYAARRPAGLRKAVVASGPASMPLYVQGMRGLVAGLGEAVREVLERGGARGSEEYKRAEAVFYAKHVCALDPRPEDLEQAFRNLREDSTAYLTIQGPSELVVTGSCKDLEGWKDAHNIEVPVLILNGRYDEMTDLCMEPWFRTIPKVKWVTFENSSHMNHWEARERYMQVVGGFLTS